MQEAGGEGGIRTHVGRNALNRFRVGAVMTASVPLRAGFRQPTQRADPEPLFYINAAGNRARRVALAGTPQPVRHPGDPAVRPHDRHLFADARRPRADPGAGRHPGRDPEQPAGLLRGRRRSRGPGIRACTRLRRATRRAARASLRPLARGRARHGRKESRTGRRCRHRDERRTTGSRSLRPRFPAHRPVRHLSPPGPPAGERLRIWPGVASWCSEIPPTRQRSSSWRTRYRS